MTAVAMVKMHWEGAGLLYKSTHALTAVHSHDDRVIADRRNGKEKANKEQTHFDHGQCGAVYTHDRCDPYTLQPFTCSRRSFRVAAALAPDTGELEAARAKCLAFWLMAADLATARDAGVASARSMAAMLTPSSYLAVQSERSRGKLLTKLSVRHLLMV
eukprot:2576828-Pleurochrysis_carterae.AAC.2